MCRIKKLANEIRQNNFEKYQKIRFPQIPDGEEIVFKNEDFRNVDFADFSLTFFTFNKCNLDGAKNINGFSIIIDNCSARGLEFNNTFSVIYANDSDFSNMEYNKSTLLADVKHHNDYSVFTNCTMNPETIRYFEPQGVRFK